MRKWKLFSFNKTEASTESENVLRKKLNTEMNYLGLEDDVQKGFLFFLGASINVGINKCNIDLSQFMQDEIMQRETMLSIINQYSTPSGNISDYGAMYDLYIDDLIYSFNYVFFNILNNESIDGHLKTGVWSTGEIENGGSSNLLEEYANLYKDIELSLGDCQIILEDLFARLGRSMNESGYNKEKSYEAGFAYYSMRHNMDANGAYALFNTIYMVLTPMYKALYMYPILNATYPSVLESNHIFSSILQMFYEGIESRVSKPIHKFHQRVFYKPESTEFNEEWDFCLDSYKDILFKIFSYAVYIRQSNLFSQREEVMQYGNIHSNTLVNAKVDMADFTGEILALMSDKYQIELPSEEVGWRHLGEFVQFSAILFYESCLHAMVIEDLIEKRS